MKFLYVFLRKLHSLNVFMKVDKRTLVAWCTGDCMLAAIWMNNMVMFFAVLDSPALFDQYMNQLVNVLVRRKFLHGWIPVV